MFLKALTLKGFKSFGDATTLEFEPGVTVVVGPNGSGKSNIVDAVAWVLGAQGPRTVRSTKMDDVIFAGSPQRPALGRAEVSLAIDNSSGRIPAPMSEITITRTLFRSGDSEYAINGAPCRLLDVQELLSDSGVGRQQHVIVGQGQLDAVLTARPEDRRLMIEEAAGVLKFRRRRERAERRLEATESNLVRLQDLLREVRRQLRPLERQAEVARRRDELLAELRSIRLYVSGRELADLTRRQEACSRQRAELASQEEALRSRLARLDAEIAAGEVELERSTDIDTGSALGQLEGLRERARGLAALLTERRSSLQRARESAMSTDVVASLVAERDDLHGQLDGVSAELASSTAALEELRHAEASLGRDLRPGGDGLGGLAAARERVAVLKHGLERDRLEHASLVRRAELLEDKVDELAREVAARRSAVADGERQSVALEDELREAQARATRFEEARALAEASLREAERESHSWSARAEALRQALDEVRARAGIQRLAGHDGVEGSLVDLVEVDLGWEDAFAAAVRDALSAVVVAGEGEARSALALLRAEGAAAGVLPTRTQVERRDPQGSLPAGTDPLRPRVRGTKARVDGLLDVLLERVVVSAGGWEEALDLHLRHPDLVVVTPEGDRFSSRGWVPAGGSTGTSVGALEEAERRAADAEAARSTAARALESADAELASTRSLQLEAGRRASACEASSRGATDALARARGQLDDAQSELAEVRARRAQVEEGIEAAAGRLEEARREVEVLKARSEAATREASESARRAAELARDRAAAEVRVAGLSERHSVLSQRAAQIDHRLEASGSEEREQQSRQAGDHLEVLERLSRVVSGCGQAVESHLAALGEAHSRQAAAVRSLVERLDSLRKERSEQERELGLARERGQRCEIDDAEIRLRLETACEALRRDLDCEPETALHAPEPGLDPGTSPQSRARELERELRIIGPVNALAQEELSSLSARHELLEGQLEDVRTARRELAKVIRAVDAEIVDIFAAAYGEVSENFSKIFSTLFPGGQGQLRLSDPADLLGTGVEVEARPLGRSVRRLSLLSGGERSLVAVAFLFAIFRSRPSPFYILDEVEAALDDVNLVKFLGLVEEFREEAQLIIVSHQKRTMEAADCLYGVSMQPRGTSLVVSERASDEAERLRETEPA